MHKGNPVKSRAGSVTANLVYDPLWVLLSWLCRQFAPGFLTPLAPILPLSPLHPILGCGFLHLLSSVDGRSLSDVDWARHWASKSIVHYHLTDFWFYSWLVMFWPRFLNISASSPWQSRNCRDWAPSCDLGLKFDVSLVSHSHKTLDMTGSTSCRLNMSQPKALWLGWCSEFWYHY